MVQLEVGKIALGYKRFSYSSSVLKYFFLSLYLLFLLRVFRLEQTSSTTSVTKVIKTLCIKSTNQKCIRLFSTFVVTLFKKIPGLYPALFTGRRLNIILIFLLQLNFSADLLNILQVILQLGFCMLFLKTLYEETEAVIAGCFIASRAISFASIKPIVSLTSFSSRLPHPSSS